MVDKVENIPATEKGSSEGITVLADAQLSNVKNVTTSGTDTRGSAIGSSSDFEFTNEDGHSFQTDTNGNVTKFTYNDGEGGTLSFSDIKRDDQGAVTEFKTSDGKAWTKLPGDPTSPFEAEREGGGWNYKDEETGEVSRGAVELGQVTIDELGVTATGQNADYLGLPQE